MEALTRIALGRDHSVADVLRAVRDDDRPFCLVGRWAGGGAVVGSSPLRMSATLEGLEQPPVDGPAGAVGGGWFGYLGYGVGWAIERLPPAPPRPRPLPPAALAYYDNVLKLDPDGEWWFEALPGRDLSRRLADLERRLASRAAPRPHHLDGLRLQSGAAARHRVAVAECVERIAAGELFQANLALRLEGTFRGSAADAFADAAELLQPAYGAFLGLPGGAILSMSPELFLRRTGETVVSSPIKGTARRTGSSRGLEHSEKDGAEHVMIVDLVRNDLGRVARYGTVAAGPRRTEPHPGLWHLVTDVSASTTAPDAALLKAAFPPGSVTGAPKIQAMKVIADLESTQREVYTGAIGMLSPVAGLELNVAIRTLEVHGEQAWMGAGGAVVADSDPAAELQEALDKASPIAEALGGSIPFPEPPRPMAVDLRRWPRRPDPAAGLLETVAVRGGRAIDLDRHLDRLRASAGELYGTTLPHDLPDRVARAAVGDGRLRIALVPGREVAVELSSFGQSPECVELTPLRLAGGLGRHKWLDRPSVGDALVVDLDGTALETDRANIWLLKHGRLLTPPADGRLLPGTVRAAMLEAGLGEEAPIDLSDIASADAMIVTSSIRIAVPAHLAGDTPKAGAPALAARLRRSLGETLTTR